LTLPDGFSVTAAPAALVSISPSSVPQGSSQLVTVSGAFTHFTADTPVVTLGPGVSVGTLTVLSTTLLRAEIVVAVDAVVGARDLTVRTNGGTLVLPGAFSVASGTPAIEGVNPSSGFQGQSFEVTITTRFTNLVANPPVVSFGAGIGIGAVRVTSATSV